MPIKGLGTDIVEIARVAEAVDKSDRLAQRVLTKSEMEIYLAHQQLWELSFHMLWD